MTTKLNPQPKPIKCRLPAYRKWLRSQPCCICDCMPSVGTHQNVLGDKGTGTKVSDVCMLPLCKSEYHHIGCHSKEHSGDKTFWAKHEHINREKLIVKYFVKWLLTKDMDFRPLIQFFNDWMAGGK